MTDETPLTGNRIAHVAGALLLVAVVAPFVVTGAPAVVGAEQSYVVLSGSMAAEPEPVINPGDVVVVSRVDPGEIASGDIITFSRDGGTPTTHRVVDVRTSDGTPVFTTKGDNNEEADPQPVTADQVVGRVSFVIPYVGHVVRFAGTTAGLITLIGLPVGLLVVSEAWALASDGDEESNGDNDRGTTESRTTKGESMDAATDEGTAEDRPTVTVRREQVWWALAGLIPVTAGLGVLAYQVRSAATISAFYGGVGLSLLCGAVYLRMGDDETQTDESGDPATPLGADTGATGGYRPVGGDHVVTGEIRGDPRAAGRVVVALDSLDTLRAMAHERGTRVVHDDDTGAYYVVGHEAVFRVDTGRSPGTRAQEGAPPGPTGDDPGGVDPASRRVSAAPAPNVTGTGRGDGRAASADGGTGTDGAGRSDDRGDDGGGGDA
jgi:signal peptidase